MMHHPKKISDKNSFLNTILYDIAKLRIKEGKYQEAETLLLTSDAYKGGTSRLLFMLLGKVYHETNRYEQASQTYQKSISLLINELQNNFAGLSENEKQFFLISVKGYIEKIYFLLLDILQKQPQNKELQNLLPYIICNLALKVCFYKKP